MVRESSVAFRPSIRQRSERPTGPWRETEASREDWVGVSPEPASPVRRLRAIRAMLCRRRMTSCSVSI